MRYNSSLCEELMLNDNEVLQILKNTIEEALARRGCFYDDPDLDPIVKYVCSLNTFDITRLDQDLMISLEGFLWISIYSRDLAIVTYVAVTLEYVSPGCWQAGKKSIAAWDILAARLFADKDSLRKIAFANEPKMGRLWLVTI